MSPEMWPQMGPPQEMESAHEIETRLAHVSGQELITCNAPPEEFRSNRNDCKPAAEPAGAVAAGVAVSDLVPLEFGEVKNLSIVVPNLLPTGITHVFSTMS